MKKFLILSITLFTISLSAQEINWMSFEEAITAQKESPKKIFMDAYTVWCGPCKMLDKNTFHNKDVAKYVNENYYAVKFNAEGNESINYQGNKFENPNFNQNTKGRNSSHELSNHFSIRAYPTILFLDETGNLIAPLPGYKTPKQLEIYLKLFKTDDYKNITAQDDWKNYQDKFSYEFID
ncbi:thioredoxin family protein [Lutibacter citreus]|uniref:thioredoxin family protein n=1 Tax=Lutibacter citreus TaxID=2138210 RepID=UPI000DBEA4E9|nr:thioredoxin fold domain-containing protein [Lutibacter citreus]